MKNQESYKYNIYCKDSLIFENLTEDEFFTQSTTVKKSIYRDENVCMKAITAMREPVADQYYDLGTQLD